MGDAMSILRHEFAAEGGSFLLQLRCDLHWDRGASRAGPLHAVRSPAAPGAKWALALAMASLLLSIVFGLGGITAILALMLARSSDAAIRDSSGEYRGLGLNTATRIISWSAIALSLVFLVSEAVQAGAHR